MYKYLSVILVFPTPQVCGVGISFWVRHFPIIAYLYLFHGPMGRARTHTSHQMSQGRENNVVRPGLEHRVSPLPCKYSATELPSHMSTGYISPYLIRYTYVPESARNRVGTDETVSFRLLLVALARTHNGHHMLQGQKTNVARPELEPRVSRLPREHSNTELPSHMIDR